MALQLRASTGAPRVGACGSSCADGASVSRGCGEFMQRSGPHAQGRPWSSAGQCDWATVCASESESCDGPAAGCAWPVPASSWDPLCADVAGLHSAEDAAVRNAARRCAKRDTPLLYHTAVPTGTPPSCVTAGDSADYLNVYDTVVYRKRPRGS